jgi:multiple sugar transport system substrate-binding protein
MRRSMRLVVILAAVLALFPALALTAGGTKEASAAGTATVTWGYWGSPSEVEENKGVAAEFEKTHPNIKIQHMTAPWGDYFTKLQTQFAAKSAPDVMFLTYISTYAPMGVLKEMDPLFAQYKFDKSKYPAGTLDGFTVNGKLYGLPRDNDTKVVFVNKDLFAEAGVSIPAKAWSTDEFASAAQKLTKKKADGTQQYGVMFDPGNWFLYVFMNEGTMFDNDGAPTKVAFDSSALQGLQWAGDLINKYNVTPAFDQLNNGTVRQQMFLNGQAAMLIDNHAQVPVFLAAKDLKWDVAPLPTFPGKGHHNVAGGAGYTISTYTKAQDAAWAFWQFLNTEGIKIYMKAGTMVPVNIDLLHSPEFSQGKPYNAQVFIDETVAGHGFPNNPKWWNVYSKANPFLERIWASGQTAADAYAAAQPELQKELQ